MNEGTHLGVRVQSVFGCSAEKAPLSDLFLKKNVIAFDVESLYRTLPKSGSKYGKCVSKFMYAFKKSIAAIELVLMKIIFSRQIFVEDRDTEFHENPINHLVAHTRSRTDRCTGRYGTDTRRFLPRKRRLNMKHCE